MGVNPDGSFTRDDGQVIKYAYGQANWDPSTGAANKGHWNDDGSFTWDTGKYAGYTVPAREAQNNADMYAQNAGSPEEMAKAQDAFAFNNGQGKYEGNGNASARGFTDFFNRSAAMPGRNDIDFTQPGDDRTRLGGMLDVLGGQADTGAGAWQNSLANATAQNNAFAQAFGQSIPGAGYATSLRNIGNTQAANNQRAIGQANTLRAQAQLGAADTMGSALGQQADVDAAGSVAQGAARQAKQQADNQIFQQIATDNRNLLSGAAQGAVGLTNMVGGMALASDGGAVPGKAQVFGDDEANDTVPAWLSPGEIVIPRSVALAPNAAREAAHFVAAVKKSKGGAAGYAEGGYIPGLDNFGVMKKDASIENGGLLDTANYDATRDAILGNANRFQAQAMGTGPSLSPQMQTNNIDDAAAAGMRAAAGRTPVPAGALLSSATERAQQGAGDAGEQTLKQTQHGQTAFINAMNQQRASDLSFAQARQQAAWRQAMMNSGLTLDNQNQLLGLYGAAGQGVSALADVLSKSRDASGMPDWTRNTGHGNNQDSIDEAFNAAHGGKTPPPNAPRYAGGSGDVGFDVMNPNFTDLKLRPRLEGPVDDVLSAGIPTSRTTLPMSKGSAAEVVDRNLGRSITPGEFVSIANGNSIDVDPVTARALQDKSQSATLGIKPGRFAANASAPPAPAASSAPGATAPMGAPGSGVPKDKSGATFDAAFDEQRKAAQAHTNAEVGAIEAEAKGLALRQQAADVADLQRKEMIQQGELENQKSLNDWKAAVAEQARIDPTLDSGRWWASRSTGGKIAGIIGLALGTLGAGADGVNRAAGMIQANIDRDLEAQKAEHELRLKKGQQAVDSAQGIYGAARQHFQDNIAAWHASKDALLEKAEMQTQQLLATTKSPLAQSQGAMLLAKISADRAQEQAKTYDRGMEARLKAAQTANLQAEAAKNMAASRKGAVAATGTTAGLQALDRYAEQWKKGGGSIGKLTKHLPGTNANDLSNIDTATATAIATQLNNNKAPKPALIELVKTQMLPVAGETDEDGNQKIEALKKLLQGSTSAADTTPEAD